MNEQKKRSFEQLRGVIHSKKEAFSHSVANHTGAWRAVGGSPNKWKYEFVYFPENFQFTGLNLSGLDLSNADLSGTNLQGANLINTRLVGANLAGANLSYANLTFANLTDANLAGVNFFGANCANAKMRERVITINGLSNCGLSGQITYNFDTDTVFLSSQYKMDLNYIEGATILSLLGKTERDEIVRLIKSLRKIYGYEKDI